MLVMVVFFIAFRWIHLSTPLIRLFLLVLILLLMPTLNFLPVWFAFFFFQAEDGIRVLTVTGVQTCALPISRAPAPAAARGGLRPERRPRARRRPGARRARAPRPRRGRDRRRRAGAREPARVRPPRRAGRDRAAAHAPPRADDGGRRPPRARDLRRRALRPLLRRHRGRSHGRRAPRRRLHPRSHRPGAPALVPGLDVLLEERAGERVADRDGR